MNVSLTHALDNALCLVTLGMQDRGSRHFGVNRSGKWPDFRSAKCRL